MIFGAQALTLYASSGAKMVNKEQAATQIIHSASEVVTCVVPGGGRGPRRGLDQGGAGIIANGAVALKEDRILAVGSTNDIIHQYRGENTRLVDATGKTVTPGLVDAHTHLLW